MRSEDYLPEDGRWLDGIDRKRVWSDGWGNTALVVTDMQRFFMEPGNHAYVASSGRVLKNIKYLLERYHGPVFFTMHRNNKNSSNLMVKWWKDVIEDSVADIHPEIDVSKGEVIVKEHYSAFMRTDLEERLRDGRIDTVVIAGLLTDLCCETTARDAFMRGFKVVVLADCTATETFERHICSVASISRGFGEVLTLKEFLLRS